MCDQLTCRNGAVRIYGRLATSRGWIPYSRVSRYWSAQFAIWMIQIRARKPTITNSALRASASTVSASPGPKSHIPRPPEPFRARLRRPRRPERPASEADPGPLLTVTTRPTIAALPGSYLNPGSTALLARGDALGVTSLRAVIVTVHVAKL